MIFFIHLLYWKKTGRIIVLYHNHFLSIYRFLLNGYIKITALSKGCTFFNSFEVKKSDQSESSIEVVRVRDDNCSMKPYNVDLQYSFRHLGIDKNVSVGVINQRRSVPALKSSGTSSN